MMETIDHRHQTVGLTWVMSTAYKERSAPWVVVVERKARGLARAVQEEEEGEEGWDFIHVQRGN